MKLHTVEIKNFRSIAEVELDFTAQNALALVGVNEAGKSNILRALSTIASLNEPQSDNVRVQRPDEPDITEAYVRFNFHLSKQEVDKLTKKLQNQAISKEGTLPSFAGTKGIRSFAQFAASRNEAALHFDLLSGDADVWTEVLDEEYSEVEPGWLHLDGSEVILALPWQPSAPASLAEKTLLKLVDIGSQFEIDGATPLTPKALDLMWHELLKEYALNNLPNALLWTFERENTLPATVPLDEFQQNPTICRPLQAIFEIADIKNIREEIEQEKRRGRQRLNNLLSRVGARASAHLESIWKDYHPAAIELQLDGAEIRISIKDESLSFNFADRSEGFKRLITFLLLVSAKMKTRELENSILLIDEPEASLHPAGIRNLRDELLRISQKNYVVFATHSPQMIDSRNIERHVIVRKVGEITQCEIAEGEKFFDEEVLLNCLGTSIFDSLKRANLIFEGWRDKKLFEVYLNSTAKALPALRDCGHAFVQGVKDVRNIAPMLMLASRKAIIISDHDAPALEARAAFSEARLDGIWKTYRELEGEESVVLTAEDFIRPATLKEAFDAICRNHNINVQIKEDDFGLKSRLDFLKAKLAIAGINGVKNKQILDELKTSIFENLAAEQIEAAYGSVLDTLERTVLDSVTVEREKGGRLAFANAA